MTDETKTGIEISDKTVADFSALVKAYADSDPIRTVYEKYKHLDHLLTDTDWLPNTWEGEILCDFWQAIKKSVEGDG